MVVGKNILGKFTDCYWVETDETEGKVILSFEDLRHPTYPKAAYLILNIPNVQDASSATVVIVKKGDKKICSMSDINW